MIILLHGEDTYRLQRKLREIENAYKEVHGNALNLEKFDASELSFRGFLDASSQQSMFVDKKLFFLENVFTNEEFKKEFLKKIDELSKSEHIFVLVEKNKIKKTNKFLKALEKSAKCQEFETLSGIKLANWVKKEFLKYKAEIEPLALRQLIGAVGSDLFRMEQEIKKLSSYTKSITEKEVALFIRSNTTAEIFETIDALARGDKGVVLKMVQMHLDKGDHPFYLLKMFVYQFRNILLVKSGNKAGMHPFVFRKTTALAHRFTEEELKNTYKKIFQTDLAMKTGKISPEEGLKTLIAYI